MDSVPVTFPCMAYYRAGFRIPVASPEEFAALPPGYSLSPFGPWPTPPTFPCTVYYFDGFTVRVTSREEFAALLPQHPQGPGQHPGAGFVEHAGELAGGDRLAHRAPSPVVYASNVPRTTPADNL